MAISILCVNAVVITIPSLHNLSLQLLHISLHQAVLAHGIPNLLRQAEGHQLGSSMLCTAHAILAALQICQDLAVVKGRSSP
jgi:hypothetical protein